MKEELALMKAFVLHRDGKYVLLGQLLIIAVGLPTYFLVSNIAGVAVLGIGLLLLFGGMHTKWMYEDMRDDPDFEQSALISAIIGIAMVYSLALVVAAVIFLVLSYISMLLGFPITLPALIALFVLYAIYAFVL